MSARYRGCPSDVAREWHGRGRGGRCAYQAATAPACPEGEGRPWRALHRCESRRARGRLASGSQPFLAWRRILSCAVRRRARRDMETARSPYQLHSRSVTYAAIHSSPSAQATATRCCPSATVVATAQPVDRNGWQRLSLTKRDHECLRAPAAPIVGGEKVTVKLAVCGARGADDVPYGRAGVRWGCAARRGWSSPS